VPSTSKEIGPQIIQRQRERKGKRKKREKERKI
jgi:hypothetical protein